MSSVVSPLSVSVEVKDVPSAEEHATILKETIKHTLIWVFLIALRNLWSALRVYVWVLYARHLGEDRSWAIGLWLYFAYFSRGCFALVFGRLCDRFDFASLALFSGIVTTAGVTVEASAQSFYVFATASLIVHSAYDVPMVALFTLLLPNNEAKKHITYSYAAAAAASLCGPIITGVIVYVWSYRACFVASVIVAGIKTVLTAYFWVGKQSKLTKEQLRMQIFYQSIADMNDPFAKTENQFPQCTDQYTDTPLDYTTLGKSMFGMDMARRDWLILLLSNSLWVIALCEMAIIATWFTVYCYDRFDVGVLWSCLAIAVGSLTLAIGMIVTSMYLRQRRRTQLRSAAADFNLKIIILITASIVAIAAMVGNIFLSFHYYYATMAAIGTSMGVFSTIQESIAMDVMPKGNDIDGFRRFLKNIVSAIAIVAIGILWASRDDYVWFWLIQIVILIIGITAVIALKLVRQHKTNREMDEDKSEYLLIDDDDDDDNDATNPALL